MFTTSPLLMIKVGPQNFPLIPPVMVWFPVFTICAKVSLIVKLKLVPVNVSGIQSVLYDCADAFVVKRIIIPKISRLFLMFLFLFILLIKTISCCF